MPDTLAPPANDALPLSLRSELRFLACGSVDDGKSTLIGRLINDATGLFEDQIKSLQDDSRRFGTAGDEIDFALLLDGLEAEREQGITIDVAYRFFATSRRAFVVADTPGHQQYTRNMATGASNAELAILLVDARKGLIEQTRRHAAIVALLGIRHVVLAVNKIDLVDFSEARFREIEAAFTAFATPLAFHSVMTIPVSARLGDNIATRGARTPWYVGPPLLAHLETVETGLEAVEAPLRFPVQWVNRPDGEFRGFAGTVASGRVAVGDRVVVASSGRATSVARIVSFEDEAVLGAGNAHLGERRMIRQKAGEKDRQSRHGIWQKLAQMRMSRHSGPPGLCRGLCAAVTARSQRASGRTQGPTLRVAVCGKVDCGRWKRDGIHRPSFG